MELAVHLPNLAGWPGCTVAQLELSLPTLVGDGSKASPRRILSAAAASAATTNPKGSPARILIVDDHQVLRDGIRALLTGDPRWQVCGEASDGQEAVDRVQDLRPDLVILDVTMPVKNGLVAAREMRRLAPSLKILMFSMHESPTMKAEFNRVGADAFVMKSAPSRELISTIVELLQDSRPSGDA